MKLSDLTRGELMFVYRRRRGLTQVEAAEAAGVGTNQYREWELGEEEPTREEVRSMKAGGALEIHEIATTLRRREGMTQPELAEKLGISTNWLCRMEKGEVDMNQGLFDYWNLA